jgi:hypothetical protein
MSKKKGKDRQTNRNLIMLGKEILVGKYTKRIFFFFLLYQKEEKINK